MIAAASGKKVSGLAAPVWTGSALVKVIVPRFWVAGWFASGVKIAVIGC